MDYVRFVHREIVMLVILVCVTIAAFAATRNLAASNQMLRLADAHAWYDRGQRALQSGDAGTAVAGLRRSVTKDPDNRTYRLALAGALMADHQDDAARRVLLDLRIEQPDDPDTNLQMARLEARDGDAMAAGRYYQNALSALWKPEHAATQRELRAEFIRFLLGDGERDRALSQMLVLEVSLPADGASQLGAGRMLLEAGDARRALGHFTQVLGSDPANREALAGAAESSFQLGDYAHARQYLNKLGREGDTDRTRELRTVTDLVLSADPLAPRIPMSERRRRLAAAAGQVIGRLDACLAGASNARPASGDELEAALTNVRNLDASMRAPRVSPSLDDIEAGLDLIAHVEGMADRACGLPDPLDRALVLVGRRHGLEER